MRSRRENSGVTWFATDGGLACYNGRRTNAINAEGLPPGRVLALKTDESGALWIGTDTGAAWMWNGKFHPVPETPGKVITAIITPRTRPRDHGQRERPDFRLSRVTAALIMRPARPGEGAPNLELHREGDSN